MENNDLALQNVCKNEAMHEDMQAESNFDTFSCTCACNYECTQSNTHFRNSFFCEKGLNSRQINIISLIKNNYIPLSYKEIAGMLKAYYSEDVNPDAVRGIIERLKRRKLITSKLARLGNLRGNLYKTTSKSCEFIPTFNTKSTMQLSSKNPTHLNTSIKDRLDLINLSNLKEEVPVLNSMRQKLLNLTNEDITFFWSNLASHGFGKLQIEQIVKRLEQLGASLENVMQGLHYAEWDLANGQMKDKNGELIKSPTNWVFQILARQGYYPKPKSYTSPEEQAELDDKQEAEKLEKLVKENETREFEEWKATLSEEEIANILESEREGKRFLIHFPDRILLKTYFQKSKQNQDEHKNNQTV